MHAVFEIQEHTRPVKGQICNTSKTFTSPFFISPFTHAFYGSNMCNLFYDVYEITDNTPFSSSK